MVWHVGRKLSEVLISLLLLTIIVFGTARLLGDPTDRLLPMTATQEQREALRSELGLDQPIHVQYVSYLGDLFRGDLGDSLFTSQPVLTSIRSRAPYSILLATASTVVALLIAIPLGVLAATRRGSGWDSLARGFAAIGQSAPPFWIGILLILLFGLRLGWLPVAGSDSWMHLVLPAFTLGWFISAGVLRLLRAGMIEALRSDYVLFARSYGMSRRRVVWGWALPNALLSVATFVGYMFGIIIGGAIVVEVIFVWPGLGSLAFGAITSRDLPLIQGTVLVLAVVMIVANLVVDLFYGLIDPRIRSPEVSR